MERIKQWDVTLVRYIGIIIEAETEEQARILAENQKDNNEIVGVINEVDEEEYEDL